MVLFSRTAWQWLFLFPQHTYIGTLTRKKNVYTCVMDLPWVYIYNINDTTVYDVRDVTTQTHGREK